MERSLFAAERHQCVVSLGRVHGENHFLFMKFGVEIEHLFIAAVSSSAEAVSSSILSNEALMVFSSVGGAESAARGKKIRKTKRSGYIA